MLNTEIPNDNTDSIVQSQVEIVNDDPIDENTNTVQPEVENKRPRYEVVFFVRYHVNPRPSMEDIVSLFSKYGEVHHVNCPTDKNFAFVFMTSLNTDVPYRRTRTTISNIIRDMTPETRFHITVASSNRSGQNYPNRNYSTNNYQPNQYHQSQPNNYQPNQYRQNHNRRSNNYQPNPYRQNYNSQAQSNNYQPTPYRQNHYTQSQSNNYQPNQYGQPNRFQNRNRTYYINQSNTNADEN